MKRITLMLCLLALFFCWAIETPYGMGEDYTQTFHITKEASGKVSEYDQTQTFTIPEEPLTFTADVNWQAEVENRHLSVKKAPYFKIFVVDNKGISREEVSLGEGDKKSGTIQLKPGQFCKFQLYTGQFKSIIGTKHAAEVKASCNYQTLRVTAGELYTIGAFKLNVAGPEGYKWVWNLPGGKEIPGNVVEASFRPGDTGISVADEGLKHTLAFKLKVPEAVELNPVISATSGYEEFPVKVTANIRNHYQSTSVCSWDSGDGELVQNGVNFEHIYKRAGVYNLKLRVKNSLGSTIEKNWTITVKPFAITTKPYISPVTGAMPLEVYYNANAKVYGQPSKLNFLWDFGDGTTVAKESGNHKYVMAGDYLITLTVTDDYHQDLFFEPWSKLITVTKPSLNLKIKGSKESGIIPCQVQFESNLKVEGGPTEIEYLWDFDDGTTSTMTSPKHTFSEPGRYKVILTVRDRLNENEVSDLVIVDILPPLVMSRSALTPLAGKAPLAVQGEAVPEISGSPTKLEYEWYIDDRLVHKGKSLRHTFARPGIYTVILRISDDLPGHSARASHTWQVRVEEQNQDPNKPEK